MRFIRRRRHDPAGGRLSFRVRTIDLSRRALRGAATQAGFGYGPGLTIRPDRPEVFYGRPWGRVPSPWTRVDLTTGAFVDAQGRDGIPGDLRDGFIEPDAGEAWVLGSHGLARMSLDPMTPIAVHRAGIGKYHWRLFPIGANLLGVTGWITKSIAIVERATGTVVGRVPIRSPDLVTAIAGSSDVWLLAFHDGAAARYDVGRRRVVERRAIPLGTGPVVVGERIFLLAGTRTKLPDVALDEMWSIRVSHPVAIEARTFDVLQHGPALTSVPLDTHWDSIPSNIRPASGIDANGRLAMWTSRGIAVFDPGTLGLLGEWRAATPGAAYAPSLEAFVAIDERWHERDRLHVVTWS
jgi:hypothetical protein